MPSIKPLRWPVIAILLHLGLGFSAFSWGPEGHEGIARVAQTMLSNSVLTKVQSILDTNEMASIALWADQARQLMKDNVHAGPLKGNPEAEQFILDHKD